MEMVKLADVLTGVRGVHLKEGRGGRGKEGRGGRRREGGKKRERERREEPKTEKQCILQKCLTAWD